MTNERISKHVEPVTLKGSIKKIVTKEDKVYDFLRNAPMKGHLDLSSGISTLGGSLGGCLAKIHKYKKKKDFLLEFSKKSILSSSVSALVEIIPAAGFFLVASGFGMSFGSVVKSKVLSTTTKLKGVGNMAFKTGSQLATGTVGAFAGQIVIPIPFLGAFIGGLVGGVAGGIITEVA